MSSSIFSSEYLHRYLALPHAKKLWHVAIVFVLLGTTLFCRAIPERSYGLRRPDERISTAAIAALSNQTQVLFMGSSHIQWGIRPSQYHLPVMNLASPQLNYICIQRLAQKHLGRVPKLKVAVVEMDDVPLLIDTIPALNHDLRSLLALGLTPAEMPSDSPGQRLQLAMDGFLYPIFTLPRLTPFDWVNNRNFTDPNKKVEAGYNSIDTLFAPTLERQHDQELMKSLENAAHDQDVIERNIAALCQTINLLRQRRLTVVLLRVPHPARYWQMRPVSVQNQFKWMQGVIAARYGSDSRVLIWDWGQSHNFVDHDFADIHHLNVYGANKLARLLNQPLQELCNQR